MSTQKSKFAAAFEAQEAKEQLATERARATPIRTSADLRGAARLEHYEPAEMLLGNVQIPVAIFDVSKTGASVQVIKVAKPEAHEFVSLRLRDGRHLHGRVAWIAQNRFGLRFHDSLSTTDEILHLENRGPEVYRGLATKRGSNSAELQRLESVTRIAVQAFTTAK